MQICSPNLRHHAVARFFDSLGTHSISRVTQVLDVIKEEFGETAPVSNVVSRCLAGATLRDDVMHLSLGDLHQRIDAALVDEQDSLRRSFATVLARGNCLHVF